MGAVVAVTMVRDEADIVGSTVLRMLEQVDRVIVADNGSTDATREILDAIARADPRVLVVDDPEVGYFQSRKMTALARLAHERYGAEWIVPFDADEVWYSPFADTVADALHAVEPQWLVVEARLFDHVATADDPAIVDPVKRIRWRRAAEAPLRKVAVRWRDDLTIEQGNHRASYAGGPTIFDPLLVVRHFPYRSAEQFVRKVRNGAQAYRATDFPADVGTHWREWGAILEAGGEPAVAEIFRKWYWRRTPGRAETIENEKQPALVLDPVR